MFRLIAFALIAYVAYRLARRWLSGRTRSTPVNGTDLGRIDDVMVKDPQCGAYFPRRDGVALKSAGGGPLFCSRECREKYLAAHSESGE